MKRLMCIVGVSVAAAVSANAQAPAQDSQKGKTVSFTGCLAAGADAKSFTLSDAMPATAGKEQSKEAAKAHDMKSYRVTAGEASLKLADHVGHKVTLTGTVEETAKGAAGGAGTSSASGSGAGSKSMPSLTVTAMKHVAATCTP